jgi:DMSO/TMAO reductase YedYZ molybdopterin-dependent catalytic subunit
LLNNPERVASEGWLAFASALWIYMTPVSPKPSMHDIVAGFWTPNSYDISAGFKRGFGATINILNGLEEC